jgi:hypothetical protein
METANEIVKYLNL